MVRTLAETAPTWLAQMPWLEAGQAPAAGGRRALGAGREPRMLREVVEALEAMAADAPSSCCWRTCTGRTTRRSTSSRRSPAAASRRACS